MIPVIMSASLLIFLLVYMFLKAAAKNRLEISSRIGAMKTENDGKEPQVRKQKSKKTKADNKFAAKTKKELEMLGNQIYDVGIKMSAEKFITIWFGLTLAVPGLMFAMKVNSFICLTAAVIIAAGPIVLMNQRKKKRRNELEGQLTEALSILCSALRAGHSFQSAMNNISNEMTGTVSEEFGRMFRETQHGMTLADSMERMTERTGSADVEMMCTAILIQREVGGNLAEVLTNISDTIQQRLELKAEVKTHTASGRLSGYLVGALPVVILIAISVINPDYCGSLFSTRAGNIMLAAGAVMEVIGFIVIQKVVSIKY